ncbi:elongation factor P [Buchnera aphidicola]|uniref:elongation factor P n=1 Tax=Buchnera aphidicola TaxID=9 RepID=UPI003464E18A
MKLCHSNNFRSGLKIIFENEPYLIESSEFVKPGKGQAFVRVKLRKLLTRQLIEKTFKSTDTLEIADVLEHTASYLYNDKNFWYFFKKNTFEEICIEKSIVGIHKKWLLEQDTCVVIFWNDQPISVIPNKFVNIKVIDTSVALKGSTVNASTKLAILSTSAVIKVPLFIKIGSLIKVDTRSGEYVSRIKE